MANYITRWNPIREITAMQSLMNQLWDQVSSEESGMVGRTLALDIVDGREAYTVKTALPGVDSENIRVNLEDNYLTIEAEIPEHTVEREEDKIIVREMSSGRYARRVRLPQTVDGSKVEAQYQDGILTLTLPKVAEAQPRSIPVRRIMPGHNNN
ncbi:MAG TPA: Hsp20/alpha crystallin family protein [Aggregatilineales bacterium]|jgi:HSP20 family protein|nr:Hsp20/alpha crystallin family protein [Aggregatilineales bacterium]